MLLIFKSYKRLGGRKQASHRNTAVPLYKKIYKKIVNKRKIIGYSVGFFILLSAITTLFLLPNTGSSGQKSPVTEMVVIGKLHYVDSAQINARVQPELQNGFFSLNVNKIKKTLLNEEPWIKKLVIRRAWPKRLIIKIEEHIPKAIWNYQNVINETGQLITIPDLKKIREVLPILVGPQDKMPVVWKQFVDYDAILASIGHKIARLELAQRGAWHLRLDNGMQVILGTHDQAQRLHRFVQAYQQSLKHDEAAIAYVDMRYTTGMAVGWKAL